MSRSLPTIDRYMSPRPICIDQDQTMSDAHRLMRRHRTRHLPVLHRGRLVGIISAGDLQLLETLRSVDPDQVRVEEAMTAAPYCAAPDMPVDRWWT